MKKMLQGILPSSTFPSTKLLASSFISGYVLAILVYSLFRPQVHVLLNYIFH
jgi:hypothetical protein